MAGSINITSPTEGQTGVSRTPTIQWDMYEGMGLYLGIRIATDPAFESIIFLEDYIDTGDTSLVVSSQLPSNTQLYVQGGAFDGDIWNWGDSVGFTTISDSPPANPPVLSAPADASYGKGLRPQFSWEAAVGATSYDLQVATDTGFSNLVLNQSSIAALNYTPGSDLSSSVSYWRVRSRNSSGTSGWATHRTYTPKCRIPSVAVSPVDNSVSVHNYLYNTTFIWGDQYSETEQYDFELHDTPDCSGAAIQMATVNYPTREKNFSSGGALSYNTPYYWRVRARANGLNGDWSPIHKFTVILPSAVFTSPEGGSNVSPDGFQISVNPVSGADSYNFRCYTSQEDMPVNVTQASPTLLITDMSNFKSFRRYVVLCIPLDSVTGNTGGSTSLSNGILSPVIITSPLDEAVDVPLSTSVKWKGSYGLGISSWKLTIATDINFNNIVYQVPGLPNNPDVETTHVIPVSLNSNTEYFWKLEALSGASYIQSMASPYSFTTLQAAPEMPSLLTPALGRLGIDIPVIFSWAAGLNAETYDLQVSRDPFFTQLVVNQTGLTAFTYEKELDKYTQYYWRVRSKSPSGEYSSWTAVWYFTTVMSVAPAPASSSQGKGKGKGIQARGRSSNDRGRGNS